MGNALRFLYGSCCKPKTEESDYGVSVSTAGVSALVHDLFNYENSSQVPERLGQYVASSKKAQAKWYNKLLQAWKAAKPPPKTAEQASGLIVQTLKGHLKADLEVDAKAVGDGDGLTVYVDAMDPNEAPNVPRAVRLAVAQRAKARASRDYTTADALQQKIADAEYRVFNGLNNKDILAKKYRIRLRGIDAPEMQMPYGQEAKVELTKILQGKCLTIGVYCKDQHGRLVGDVYCNGKFAQKTMLQKGLAWHFVKYDKRPELKKWEKEARVVRVGLWASPNPQKPWEWRKNNPRD
ncbi:hypothetical protein MKX01_031713 [Papaver californicum]|nr:hypothetical protein MKX01_031713 [Papaver californicum]